MAQLYVSNVKSSVPRPIRELKGFEKFTLQPGEIKKGTFSLNQRSFAFFDVDQNKWIIENGDFVIYVGFSSRDLRIKEMLRLEHILN